MDDLIIILAIIAAPLLLIGGISFALHYFVALSSPPSQRAAWTAGFAYLAATALIVLAGVGGYEAWVPLVAFPGALITFWFWRGDFRRGWIANPEALPEGVTIANDNWQIGLFRLLAFLVIAVGIGLLRMVARGL